MAAFAQHLLRNAIPGAAMAVGAAGAMGFLGSRGDPAGIPAGIGGIFGGGASGLFSGAVLGAMAGAGAVALAARNPTARSHLGSALASVIQSRPVQHLTNVAASIPSSVPGAAQRMSTVNFMRRVGGMPHHNAMAFLESYLMDKSARRMAMGSVAGAMGGAIVGAPLGMLTRSYRAGQRESVGPMGYGLG